MKPSICIIALGVTITIASATCGQEPAKKLPPAPEGVTIEQNVAYLAPERTETADLYLPAKRAKGARSPAVVIIHGGGWTGGDKAAAREFNIGTNLALDGYVAISINYVLATKDKATWPQNLHDCMTAVRWLRKNAERLQVDPDRIGVIGGSAGGHLAAMVGVLEEKDGLDPKGPYREFSCRVQCAVPMYGPMDLTEHRDISMLGKTREQAPELYRAASPVTYVRKNTPPMLILHGTADKTVDIKQSEQFAAALKKVGAVHELVLVEGAPHTFHLQPKQRDLRPVVLGFLDKHLQVSTSAQDERTPRQVAEQLAAVYGRKLDQVAYIPALPLVAKLRLSELTGETKYADEVNTLVAPYLRGDKTPVPKNGSEQAGHLIFVELANRAKGKERERWTLLCRNAADQIFSKDGKALPIMPFHSEMSDAVFMAGPILAATGKLTGERKYFDAAAGHFASMRKLCLRKDGIYRHSPLCEAAWGRGNGFPALGLALALSDWPDDHPARKELIAEFQKHTTALKPYQDAKTGCWHQVIDHPESYDEYSCTCMIGFAMQRGITRGWLAKDEYQPSIDRAWRAIKERTSVDGKLVNVCTGTGKQKTLQDYFARPAINGRDDRGGAMGMMFATELMAAEKRSK